MTAANQEFARKTQPSSAGWDPFEVWRTRVKTAQDSTQSANSIA
jgi:hypothetical protein